MIISNKIKKLKRLARKSLYDEEYSPDYIMIAIDLTKNGSWHSIVIYENSGDGHPEYVDYKTPASLILMGEGDTLAKSLNHLEERLLNYIKESCGED